MQLPNKINLIQKNTTFQNTNVLSIDPRNPDFNLKIKNSTFQKKILLPRLRQKSSNPENKNNLTISPSKIKETNKSYKNYSTGIWRLEYGNEDRGIFVDVWEPIFDPVFGGSPTDGGMSWGLHLSYTPHAFDHEWGKVIRRNLPWINDKAEMRASYSIEQSANMHSGLTRKNRKHSENLWTSDQRPDAGYLAGNLRLGFLQKISSNNQRIDMLDLSTGIVGPYSGAQGVHQIVHDLTGGSTDKWHQINSEPFINLNYEYGHRFFPWTLKGLERLEIHPHAGLAFGNAMVHAKSGLSLRVGKFLKNDMGAPRLSQMLSGSNFPKFPASMWSWNIFTSIEGRAHAYNILLDENLISGGQSVNSHPFTYDVQAGFELGYGNYRLTAMNVYRSREYKGQQYTNEFVRVALASEF